MTAGATASNATEDVPPADPKTVARNVDGAELPIDLSDEAPPLLEGTGNTDDLGAEGSDWWPADTDLGEIYPELDGIGEVEPSDERAIIGSDGRTLVNGAPTGFLTRNVWLRLENASGVQYGTCSGALVATNYVLTAGHCVFDGGWTPYITAHVAHNQGSGSGVICAAIDMWTSAAWQDSSAANGDWGLLKISCNAGTTYGTLPLVSLNAPVGQTARISGYPGEYSEGRLAYMDGKIASANSGQLFYTIDTTGGQRGTPVVVNGQVVGVHTTGSASQNSGVRLTPGIISTLNGIM